MGEATKGERFSSSLVYALIKISACGTIVRSTRIDMMTFYVDACALYIFSFIHGRSLPALCLSKAVPPDKFGPPTEYSYAGVYSD